MSYSSSVLADSPIRYWQLRETSGITATDLTGVFNGTYTPNSAGSWTGGLLNQTGPMAFGCVKFNGTTGYIDTGVLPISGLAHLSVEFFVKIAGTGVNNQGIFSSVDSAQKRFEIGCGGTFGGVQMGLAITIGDNVAGSSSLGVTADIFTAATWYHCVIVYDGTLPSANRVVIYVNGAAVTVTNVGAVVPPTTIAPIVSANRIGQSAAGFFNDNLAETAVYNTSLTATQALTHYVASGAGPAPATFTSVVPATGDKVNLTFTQDSSPNVSDFEVLADNIGVDLLATTGVTTAWSLLLAPRTGWIVSGQAVRVSYFGTDPLIIKETEAATNSSSRTAAQKRYVQRGFGNFLHLSSSTWGSSGAVSLGYINAIDMPSYNMAQWFSSVIVPSGARYAVLTTKHDAGFCLWPTASGSYNIAQTAFGVAHPGADLVRDFVNACRANGIAVGLYINFYDPWWTTSRPGADGGYSNPAYITYMNQQITELFSNYGVIDLLWIDSLGYSVGYGNYPWATLVSLRDSLQPGCLLINNDHVSDLSKSDIAVFEGGGGGGSIPASSNILPAEFTEDSRFGTPNDPWIWSAANEGNYKDVYSIAAKVQQTKAARTAYLLNFPPNTSGLMPTSTGTYAALLASIIGKQGVTGGTYTSASNVRYGVDRGDGQLGLWGGGINSSAILGVV